MLAPRVFMANTKMPFSEHDNANHPLSFMQHPKNPMS